MPNPIRALIFDLEGVVADTMRTVWIPADIEFCRRRGKDCPTQLLTKLTGTSLLEGVEILKEFHGFSGDNHVMLQERLDLTNELFKKEIQFINGFPNFITQHKNMPAAIATSLRSEYLTQVDERLQLTKLFNGHVYSIYGVNVRAKPNPDIFLYAAKQLGVPPEECLVFEDAPNGIEAARRAGMRSVALTTSFSREHLSQATVVVDRYEEVPALDRL